MGRPESERRYLRQAVKEGLLTVDHATTIIAELERRREGGLHAIRDIAIRTGKLTEKVAYHLFHRVSKEMREVPGTIRRIDGFEVLGPLGRGSMSVVFKARQVSLDKTVALKVLPPGLSEDPVFQERFLREARAVAKLNHPNIVAALDAGYADGYHYFAMEYVDGSTVRDIVAARGPIDEREALKVAYFVSRALKQAHAAGVVHRDVKPANIMLTRDGKVKLTDLGLARIENDPHETHLTEVGKSVGTPYYMSPEQAKRGKVADGRADLYALGATLFYMLTGRPPYDGETPSIILEKHIRAPIPDPRAYEPDLHERTAIVVRRALAKRPEERYQTPSEMASAIKAVLQGRSPNSPDPDAEKPSVPSRRAYGAEPAAATATAAKTRSGRLPPVARTPSPGQTQGEIPSIPSLPAIPALPQLPSLPLAPIYVAAQAPQRGRGGASNGMSSMTLTPVWLDPVTGKSTLGQANRARRRAPRARRDESSIPLIISLVVALVGVGAGALIAFSGGGRSSEGDPRSPRRDSEARASREPGRSSDGSRAGGAVASSSSGARGKRTLSLDEEQRLKAEALDRAEEERLRNDPLAAEQARLAKEAKRNAAEAAELERRAAEERKKREGRAAEELAKGIAEDTAAHARLLGEVAEKLKAEDVQGAAKLLDAAVQRYGTQSVKVRAELDLAGLVQVERLAELAAKGLEKRKGQKERLTFQRGVVLEGEVLEVTAQGEVAIRPLAGGRLAYPVRELIQYEQRRLARLGVGEKAAEVYACEGLYYMYSQDLGKARRRLELAAKDGFDAKIWLDRLAELEGAGAVSGAEPPPSGQKREPGKEVAGGPSTGPAGGAPAPGSDDDDEGWERAGGASAGSSAGASAGEKKPEKGPAPVERLTEEMLQKLFEFPPRLVAPTGEVRFEYALMEKKRLPSDFAVEGGDLRFDAETQTLKIEGPPHRITHKAVFEGEVKLEVQLAFPTAPNRSSAVVLFAEEAAARESTILSTFGLDLAEKRKGKVANRSGAADPLEVAIRETKPLMAYRYHLHVDALTLAGVDGGTRARIEGVEMAGVSRRVGIASTGVNAQLRALDIEGKLDLRWVAKELQRRGPR